MKPKFPSSVAIIGLGYVGLPVAVAFAEAGLATVGFDIDVTRVDELNNGIDRTLEVDANRLMSGKNLTFTSDLALAKECTTFIVTVPTPVNVNKQPDLSALYKATESVASVLKSGDIVVYESTVYPGATEEVCIPLLERLSGLTFGMSFHVGYSPERINPGDREHTLRNITKIVSASNPATLTILSKLYGSIVHEGVHEAPSIKVAEAAKVIENTQRDLNIALMNELAIIFDRLNIRTSDVLEAAGTKWNFLKFRPGLVGGHCIGVDPYYLTAKATEEGYYPELVLAGRRTNDAMSEFVAQKGLKMLGQHSELRREPKIGIYGITFKENVPDTRNSKVPDIVYTLQNYGHTPLVFDPLVEGDVLEDEYGLSICCEDQFIDLDLFILAVPHKEFLTNRKRKLDTILASDGIIIDVKAVLDYKEFPFNRYWSL